MDLVIKRHSLSYWIFLFAGYYVEKDVDSAKEYFTKKVKYVTEQMEKVQGIGNEKAKIREAVMDVMEQKLQVQFAQQQSGAKAVKWWYSIVMFFLSHKYTVHKSKTKANVVRNGSYTLKFRKFIPDL